jgi:mono/diheme cytochrome c family protein
MTSPRPIHWGRRFCYSAWLCIPAGVVLWLQPSAGVSAGPTGPAISFDRQIRPILAENCFACHGPDAKQRKAKLRLDLKEAALGSGVIVPGKSGESELYSRVSSDDAQQRMPPKKTGKRLTAAQIALLRQWIDQGAPWTKHWAFERPQRPPVPAMQNKAWARNAIDHFIGARLDREGLTPPPEADRVTLIRRVTLDLTGLPPTPREVDTFLADTRAGAYERLVDRLLDSPRFGERMALDWLDAARFADTHGYHIDSGRDMTPWRDWVIAAFNHNLPFDQFTVEQLAGDLLPNATLEQRIASGFNRNHMINFEGGAIPEEYHTAYIVDRVNTTATVWLGLTLGCCQCHDHKFDPFTQKDFYRLYAYFNNVPENGLDGSKGNATPFIKVPTDEQNQQLAALSRQITEVKKKIGQQVLAVGTAPSAARAVAALNLRQLADRLSALHKTYTDLERRLPSTMVMQEMSKPRDTFMLVRGQYDKHGEKVTPGVPERLPPAGAPANRLGLARWLVDPAHPLTARVTVNRYWQMYFGTGLVKTAEDFGSQGEWPSHPELLDWLATEFIRTGWNVKQMQRLIVTSATYRQSSVVRSDVAARDPENRLLARAPRLRLPAELIRDQALAVSGLLNGEIGGKSVFPYQPPGLWEELMSREDGANWTAQTYVQSHGKDLYRRSVYTFWKRTSPPPSLATFDAPDREVCTVRRARTNTPLQSLVLMNDPTYVEAARKLAERLIAGGKSPDERIALAFRLVLGRRPKDAEREVLRKLYAEQLEAYRKKREPAGSLLAVGESPHAQTVDPVELAAWTVVANTILNLDETVTRG